jgi:hypothetical protein
MLKEAIYTPPRLSDRDLLKIFPEAWDIVPVKLAEWRRKGKHARRIVREMQAIVETLSAAGERWVMTELIKMWALPHLRLINGHIVRLDRLQSLILNIPRRGQVSDADITQARGVPVSAIVAVSLKEAGQTCVGHCPLHDDKSPSFHIYPDTNSWYCFGCKRGGDTIAFIRMRYGLSFRDAVHYLTHHHA